MPRTTTTVTFTPNRPETPQQIADRLAAEAATKARAEKASAAHYLAPYIGTAPFTLNSLTRNGDGTVTIDYTLT